MKDVREQTTDDEEPLPAWNLNEKNKNILDFWKKSRLFEVRRDLDRIFEEWSENERTDPKQNDILFLGEQLYDLILAWFTLVLDTPESYSVSYIQQQAVNELVVKGFHPVHNSALMYWGIQFLEEHKPGALPGNTLATLKEALKQLAEPYKDIESLLSRVVNTSSKKSPQTVESAIHYGLQSAIIDLAHGETEAVLPTFVEILEFCGKTDAQVAYYIRKSAQKTIQMFREIQEELKLANNKHLED